MLARFDYFVRFAVEMNKILEIHSPEHVLDPQTDIARCAVWFAIEPEEMSAWYWYHFDRFPAR